MAGILDKKTRFIDLHITQEGKRQIASGELRAEYASVTDMHAFYKKHQTADDVKERIYFEVAERPENSIVLEKDDSGRLVQQDVLEGATIVGENLFQEFVKDSGLETARRSFMIATGSQFNSLSDGLTNLSINHLDKNFLISTKRLINDDEQFTLNKNDIQFTISNSVPFPLGPDREVINIDDSESFMTDKKLAVLDNFSFLPPVNEDGSNFGSYRDIRNTSETNFEQIIQRLGLQAYSEIEVEESEAYNVKKNTAGDLKVYNREDEANFEDFKKIEFETIKFINTSIENNLMIQVFETKGAGNKSRVLKLDIIDAGMFPISNDINNRNEKHVFYAGKIFFDSNNVPKFLNLFTIIFD